MDSSTILIVEDDRLLRWSLATSFRRAGYRVLEAQNGKAARRLIRRGFELALLDMKLPDTDGLALLRSIREVKPLCPAVVMSADTGSHLALEAAHHQAVVILPKPFRLDAALAVVQRTLADHPL